MRADSVWQTNKGSSRLQINHNSADVELEVKERDNFRSGIAELHFRIDSSM